MNNDGSRSDQQGLNLSDSELNKLINTLFSTRSENPDVVVIDNIARDRNSGRIIDPIEQEKYELEQDRISIENEIINGIFNSSIPMEMEELNMLKANGIHDKYINMKKNEEKHNDEDDEILKEIMSNIKKPLPGDIIDNNNGGDIVMDNNNTPIEEEITFQESNVEENTINEDTVDVNDEASIEDITEDIEEEVIVEEVTSTEETTEDIDLNDIPVTETEISDERFIDVLNENGYIKEEDTAIILDVMHRYKSGEKFKVYDALPASIKMTIANEAMANGFDKSMMEYAAKTFINDLIDNTYLNDIIKEYNEEMTELLGPINNIGGAIIDECSKESDERFTKKIVELANDIKEENPEKSEQLIRVSENYKKAFEFGNIINLLKERPSAANRAYKCAKTNWSNVVEDFMNDFSNISPKFKNPNTCLANFINIGANENITKAFLVLVIQEIYDVMKKTDDESYEPPIEDVIYCYYLLNSVFNSGIITYKAESLLSVASDNIKVCFDMIANYMDSVNNSKKTKKKKGKK